MKRTLSRIALGVLLLGFPAVARPAAGPDPSPPQRLSVRGKVVGPDGKPVAGATVYLREWAIWRKNQQPEAKEVRDILATTRTDEQGKFAFQDVAAPKWNASWAANSQSVPYDVIAAAKGYGLAWEHLSSGNPSQPLTLTLSPEAQVQGRLLDAGGKPVAGARVQVVELQTLDQPLRVAYNAAGALNLHWSQVHLVATSDAAGRFVLEGLPNDLRVTLIVSDDRFVREAVYAATTDQPQPKVVDQTYSEGQVTTREQTVHTGPFTITLQPGHRLRGRVVFTDTGKPVAGVHVILWRRSFDTTTDAEGRFALAQLPPGNYGLHVSPPEKTDYLGINTPAVIAADKPEVEQDVKLPRGIPVTGQVVEEGTGKGIAGVTISYPMAWAKAEESGSFPGLARTEADGSFRIAVPPGKGYLSLGSVPGFLVPERYLPEGRPSDPRFSQAIDVKPDQPLSGVKFTLSRGLVVTVVDREGKPVPGARISAPISRNMLTPGQSTDAEGRFMLSGLNSEQAQELFIVHSDRKLGARVSVAPPKDKKPVQVEVQLRPLGSATGRVLDENQRPLPAATVLFLSIVNAPAPYGGVMSSAAGAPLRTDAEGKFTIDTLLPGGQYNVQASASGHAGVSSSSFEIHAGEVHRLPDLILPKADQTIAGVVVDPSGEPLAGVQVYGHPEGSRAIMSMIPRTTDKEGRFRITGLPKGSVLLNVQKRPQAGPSGSPVQAIYTSLRVQAGRQDVRVILFGAADERAAEAAAGKPAPEFPVPRWLHRDSVPQGRGFVREDFRGKVVLLAFLDQARPSQRLLSRLNQVQRELADKGLVVVRVYETPADRSRDPAEQEWAKLSPTAAALVEPSLVPGGYSVAFRKYGVRATPTLFLLDRQGVLRMADPDGDALEAGIQELLKR